MKEWILPAFGAFLVWGLWSFIPKITVRYISARSAVIYEVLGGVIVAAIVLYSLNFRPDVHPKGVALGITTGVLGFLGALFFLFAVSKGPVSLIATLTALYPVISILLAIVVLNETITLKQGVGIILALTAMFLVTT
ncbi:MAG: EamA family transporter [Acidiferrobacterales bacterium]